MPTFALNFSRPGAQVAAQYYTMIRLGHEGYRGVQQACRDTATWLSGEIAAREPFTLISDGGARPVFAFRLADGIQGYSVYDVSEGLRVHGWLVPAYPMAPGMEDVDVLRVVVRNGFSRDLAQLLLADLDRVIARLEAHGGTPGTARPSFHH
jgi:glutamate decarboxylase